jgi:hypothetical protein
MAQVIALEFRQFYIFSNEASSLVMWVSLTAFVGRLFCSYLSDAIGRRWSGILACAAAAATLVPAGYWANRASSRR